MQTFLRDHYKAISFLVIAILTSLLYVPFLSNEIVFDDHNLFITGRIYDYAQTPFSLLPRSFPYFTLGFIQIVFGSIEANRIFSLFLHIGCAWMIFIVVNALLRQTNASNANTQSPVTNQNTLQINLVATIAALFFALNPIAVYGAGYLVQRSIVFATLLSLISLWCYHRAFAENKFSCIFTAALFYSAAIFCKEHAITLPAAIVALTVLYPTDKKTAFKRASIFLLLCLPAAITVFWLTRNVVGNEPDASAIAAMFNLKQIGWFTSFSTQSSLFFRYLFYWFAPNINVLSADMRIDFSLWENAWLFIPSILLFACMPLLASYCILRSKHWKLFGIGLFYCWALFMTEIVAIRFQEVFVLYRSYVWAPGYVLMLVNFWQIFSVKTLQSKRLTLCYAIATLATFFFLAQNRLLSLSNDFSLWQDAADKLASKQITGANRILYNRGREYLGRKEYMAAIKDFTDALAYQAYPAQLLYMRGTAYYGLQNYTNALMDFEQALSRAKTNSDKNIEAQIQFVRGLVFEKMGCVSLAEQAFSASLNLGLAIANIKIHNIKNFQGHSTDFDEIKDMQDRICK